MSILPNTLLILVHLHLLNYPLSDSSAYNEHLFDPTRIGIRERTKAMEDVSYFLVGKVEGGKERAKLDREDPMPHLNSQEHEWTSAPKQTVHLTVPASTYTHAPVILTGSASVVADINGAQYISGRETVSVHGVFRHRVQCLPSDFCESAKMVLVDIILPSYPCLQPSDTTAFRISLAKYLETLRHSSIYPSHAEHKQKTRDTKTKQEEMRKSCAWWWQDVVVRKSLIEECSGDRFERLLLALSIHALWVNTPGPPMSQPDGPRHSEALETLPQSYASILECAQSARRAWEQSASRLVHQQQDLSVLRERLLNPTGATLSSKYVGLSTDRLLALRESRLKDLLHTTWKSEHGLRALHFLIELAGLEGSLAHTVNDKYPAVEALDATANTAKADTQHTATLPTLAPVPPLPIAAAHHPVNVCSLSAPLFALPNKGPALDAFAPDVGKHSARKLATACLAERVSAAERTQQVLREVMSKLEKTRLNFQEGFQQVGFTAEVPSDVPMIPAAFDLAIWRRPSRTRVDLKTPDEGPSSSTLAPPVETAVEERIARIRATLSPAYPEAQPPIAITSSSSGPSSVAASASRLPQPSETGQWRSLRQDTGHSRHQSAKTAVVCEVGHKPVISHRPDRPQGKDASSSAQHVSRKVSRRASAAKARRTTLLPRPNALDDDVDKILEAVEDGSPLLTNDVQTPRAKPGTAGTLLSTIKKTMPRRTFDIEQHERTVDVHLPKLRLSEVDTHDLHADASPEDGQFDRNWLRGQGADQGDEDYHEGHSLTLRDILLKATNDSMANYNLLEEEGEDECSDDEAFEWT